MGEAMKMRSVAANITHAIVPDGFRIVIPWEGFIPFGPEAYRLDV
jgi:hypothetical protein